MARDQAHSRCGWQFGQQGCGAVSGLGQNKIGANVGQRLQNEASLGHAGMGQLQSRRVQAEVSHVEQIQVDLARAVALANFGAAGVLLEFLQAGQTGIRTQ